MKKYIQQTGHTHMHIYVLFSFILVVGLYFSIIPQTEAATTEYIFPTSGDDSSENPWDDNSWTSSTNIYSDDGATANITASTFDLGDKSYVLKAQGFDFNSIPDNATIVGVQMRINAYGRSGQGVAALGLCQLLDVNGARVGTDLCSSPTVFTSQASYTVNKGASNEPWGNALTPAWIKDPDFGVGIGIQANANDTDVDVDYIALSITYVEPLIIGGVLYEEDKITPISTNKTIKVAVIASTSPSIYSTTTDSAGNWSIDASSDAVAAGTPIVAWVDGDTTTRATVSTLASSYTPILDLDLYQNRVVVRNESTIAGMTNALLGAYDGDDDADIQYAVSEPRGSTSWKSYVDSLSVFVQEIAPNGLAFSSDGLRMFMVGSTGDNVYEYTLGTAWDVSTASYVDSFSVAAQETSPSSLAFSSDGLKMFVLGSSGDDVNEYTLGTAWDVSTASYVDSFSVAAQETIPLGLAFSSDGLKMFVTGNSGDDVNEYTLGTAWDVSTASYVDSFSVAAQDIYPSGIAFSSDGLVMFMVGSTGKSVYEYTLGTAWDVSTASYIDSFSVAAQENISPNDIALSSDGFKMFVPGNSGNVNEYMLLSAISDLVVAAGSELYIFENTDYIPYGKVTLNGGSGGSLDGSFHIGENSTTTVSDAVTVAGNFTIDTGGSFSNPTQYPLTFNATTTGKNLSGDLDGIGDVVFNGVGGGWIFSDNATTSSFTIYSGTVTTPTGTLAIDGNYSNNGTVNFLGETRVYGTAFDVSTASFVDSFSVAAQETNPTGLAFSNDGLKMFVLGQAGMDVNEYTLGTAFDVSTASFVDSFSVAAQETNPTGLAFSNDGLEMFVLGQAGMDVNEYTLGTAFDVSTASFVDSFSVAAQEGNPYGLAFSNDGYKMFVIGENGDAVNGYTLGTAFDVSTASFVDSFYVGTQEDVPYDLAFSNDGLKMFVLGGVGRDVNEYDLAPHTFSGNMTGTNAFGDLIVEGDSGIVFANNASTTNLTNSGLVHAPSALSVAGNLSNTGSFTHNEGTLYLTGNSKTVSGDLAGENALYDTVVSGSYTFTSNASTTNLTIENGARVIAPSSLTLAGSYTNNGTFDANNGLLTIEPAAATSTAGASSWDITTATYDGAAFSVSAQETQVTSLAFKPDGTKFYINGYNSDAVMSYTLSTPWDVTTASYDSISFSTAGQDAFAEKIAFKTDGTKMYVLGSGNDRVFQYTLSTPWAVNTASYDSVSLSVGSQDGTPFGMYIKKDGTRLYIAGAANDRIYSYTLATPWNLSTASYDSKSFLISGQETSVQDVAFSDDGTMMYTLGYTADTINQYTLSTPWDVTTASHDGSKSVTSQESVPDGLEFSDDGTKFFVHGENASDIFPYSVSIEAGVIAAGTTTLSGNMTGTSAFNDLTLDAPQTFAADGETWVGRDESENSTWSSITYGNGMFVALAYSGTNRVMTSPDGITWTSRSAAEANSWNSITYGNGLFVAVAGNGTNQVMTSPDGITWTGRTAAAQNEWYGVTYGEGLFVAVAHKNFAGSAACSTNCVMTSPDGITWTARTAAAANEWEKVTYGEGLFVAIASTGTDMVMTSPDGITWTSRNVPGNAWYGIAYGNGIFVAVAYDWVITSPDGITWTSRTNYEANGWQAVTYGGGLFIAVAPDGTNRIMTSTDGIDWTPRTAPANNKWWDITFGENTFVAVAQQTNAGATCTTTCVMTSTSGDLYGEVVIEDDVTTADLSITANTVVTAPENVTIAGDYTNEGAVEWGSGTVIFSGASAQTATGTMTGADAFHDLQITNNAATTTFGAALDVDGEFIAASGAIIEFPAGATSTLASIELEGVLDDEIVLRSTEDGTQWGLDVETQVSVVYVDVKDSNACSGNPNIVATDSLDSGNNTCWSITAPIPPVPASISSALNQTFSTKQTSVPIATITVTDSTPSAITAAKDLRVSINTDKTDMLWDTTDTTATFGGTASGKVSNPVSYENDGAVLVVPVSSNFTAGDTLTIADLSFAEFGTPNEATTTLSLVVDQGEGEYVPSTGAFVETVLSVAAQETAPEDMLFNNDGTVLYVLGQTGEDISAYTLSTPYDISTATFDKIALSVAAQAVDPQAMIFNNTGTVLYVVSWNSGSINAYTLSTPYDISTGVSSGTAKSISSQTTLPTGILFNNDGTVLYILSDSTDNHIYAYTLSTPYNISTATYSQIALTITAQGVTPTDMLFNNDGTVLYVLEGTYDKINAYTLSTPYDISTATFDEAVLSVFSHETGGSALLLNGEGAMLYVLGFNGDDIDAYTLSEPYNIASASFHAASDDKTVALVAPTPTLSSASDQTFEQAQAPTSIATITVTDDAIVPTITAANDLRIMIDTVKTDMRFDTTDTTATMGGTASGKVSTTVSYENDGTTLVVPVTNDFAASDTLTIADLSFAQFGRVNAATSSLVLVAEPGSGPGDSAGLFSQIPLSVASQETFPMDMLFNNTGTVLYVLGTIGDDINAYTLSTPYDISTAAFDEIALSIASQETSPYDMLFNDDGTVLYVMGNSGRDINAYTLSTPYDISTGVFSQIALSVSAEEFSPHGMLFNDDGTVLYVMGENGDDINAYTLSTPYDISTGVFSQIALSIGSQEGNPFDMLFNNDGTMLYVVGYYSRTINAYTLSTPYDISTAAFDEIALSIESPGSNLTSMSFNDDGTILYVTAAPPSTINAYTLSTPYDIGSAIYVAAFDDKTVTITERVPAPVISSAINQTFAVGQATTSIATISVTDDAIEPTITAANDLRISIDTTRTDMLWDTNDTTATMGGTASGKVSTTVSYENDGTTLVVPVTNDFAASDTLTLSGLSFAQFATPNEATSTLSITIPGSGYDISTAAFSQAALSVAAQENTPTDMLFNNTGTVLYVLGVTGQDINKYNLSTPYDISTATFSSIALSVAAQETLPTSIIFNNTGTVLYVMGISGQDINKYNLSTPYDISTATFSSIALSVAAQETQPFSMLFNDTGTVLYVVGTTGDDINAYTLSTPYDISTASFSSIVLSVAAQENNPSSMRFNNDGTVLYVVGTTGDDINAYTLSTPYDISTASFSSIVLSVASQETYPYSMIFNDNGSALYVTGASLRNINEYTLDFSAPVAVYDDKTIAITEPSTTPTLSSETDQTFAVGQAATSIATITVTDAEIPAITATNDIRIAIDTAKTDMLFDTTDTTATMGGTASGKVSNTVSYEDSGATLVVNVTNDFAANDTLTISGLSFAEFGAINTATSTLSLSVAESSGTSVQDDKTVAIRGSAILAEHTAGQISNAFSAQNKSDTPLYRFKLTPGGENTNIASTVFRLSGIRRIDTSNLSDFKLYRDDNSNGTVDASDTQIGGNGGLTISGSAGTVTFLSAWSATTTKDYILTADVANVLINEYVTISLPLSGIIGTGATSEEATAVVGIIPSVQHIRNGNGNGSSFAIGGDAPSGDGTVGGGGDDGGGGIGDDDGQTGAGADIGNEEGFNPPTATGAQHNQWTNGANAYASDNQNTTSATSGLRQSYSGFGFNIPSGNQIVGIAIKVEGKGSGGSTGVELSWNGGANYTSMKYTSPSLNGTETVYMVGGAADTWGRTWNPNDFSNQNFVMRITSYNGPDGTNYVDAIQIRVYHQASGGGGGGGGEI